MSLRAVALGVAIGDADNRIREVGGNNRGPRVMQYLANCDPPINVAAPWCAAAVQYWTDVAAANLGMANPLDAVRLEAYVQSYRNWAVDNDLLVPEAEAEPGDLVLYDFRGIRWDHIGMLVRPPSVGGGFWAVEGNTGSSSQRDGDGVHIKGRRVGGDYPVCFVRWSP